jgi:hypothetical protein
MGLAARPELRPEPPPAIDDGVIEEARERQRRRRDRVAAATLVSLALALLALVISGTGMSSGTPVEPQHRQAVPLGGPALTGPTHLRLIASENGGTVYVVDVDSGSARAVPGFIWPVSAEPQVELTPAAGGALATVPAWPTCVRCTTVQRRYLISANGSVRALGTARLAPHEYATPAVGSNASWVLTWPRHGGCTLALVPGSRPPVSAPCGDLGGATAAGLIVWTGRGTGYMLVDPLTGRIVRRATSLGSLTPLGGDLALDGSTVPLQRSIALVNLRTGQRTPLRWPSILGFSYRSYLAPHGPFVAVEFADPAYPGYSSGGAGKGTIGQASDVWLLDTRTGKFTHVPGYPILEALKFSSVAWTADGRLVVVASSLKGDHATLGLWHPGQQTMPVRAVPALHGYSQFVALAQ